MCTKHTTTIGAFLPPFSGGDRTPDLPSPLAIQGLAGFPCFERYRSIRIRGGPESGFWGRVVGQRCFRLQLIYPGAGVEPYSQLSNCVYAVSGSNSSPNAAIIGIGTAGPGVEGTSLSSYGVYSNNQSSTNLNPAIYGASLAAPGVRGASTTARGGVFSGGAGQIRLLPSKASTHPASGQPGDFFVDSSHRLWHCKGGTTWKQLA
jgi:hypothetical protein